MMMGVLETLDEHVQNPWSYPRKAHKRVVRVLKKHVVALGADRSLFTTTTPGAHSPI